MYKSNLHLFTVWPLGDSVVNQKPITDIISPLKDPVRENVNERINVCMCLEL